MNITKCDICKKNVAREDIIRAQGKDAGFSFFEFCEKCGKPITKFLISKKLIDIKRQNGKKSRN